MKIVVVSPHRDDAAFSLSLCTDSWLHQGHSVTVVNCFTRSTYAPYSDVDSLHLNDRMSYVTALRLREDESWRRQYGSALHRLDLNLKDAPLRLRCTPDEVCSTPINSTDKASLKIHKAVGQLAPDALVLPLAIGSHVDHLTARDALLPLCSDQLRCAFYEDLPYAARPGAAQTILSFSEKLNLNLEPVFTEAEQDQASAEQRKRKLVLCYDSQISDETAAEIVDFSQRYDGRERLWAGLAWRNSTLHINGAQHHPEWSATPS